jgi:hypothetical protein
MQTLLAERTDWHVLERVLPAVTRLAEARRYLRERAAPIRKHAQNFQERSAATWRRWPMSSRRVLELWSDTRPQVGWRIRRPRQPVEASSKSSGPERELAIFFHPSRLSIDCVDIIELSASPQ